MITTIYQHRTTVSMEKVHHAYAHGVKVLDQFATFSVLFEGISKKERWWADFTCTTLKME